MDKRLEEIRQRALHSDYVPSHDVLGLLRRLEAAEAIVQVVLDTEMDEPLRFIGHELVAWQQAREADCG